MIFYVNHHRRRGKIAYYKYCRSSYERSRSSNRLVYSCWGFFLNKLCITFLFLFFSFNLNPATKDISCFCCFIVRREAVGTVGWNMFLGLAEFHRRFLPCLSGGTSLRIPWLARRKMPPVVGIEPSRVPIPNVVSFNRCV